jgi:hypothetical protein
MLFVGVFRLIGCQDLLEEVPPSLDQPENLLMAVACPPDYKSLPRMSKSVRGSAKNGGGSGFRDEPSSKHFLMRCSFLLELHLNFCSCTTAKTIVSELYCTTDSARYKTDSQS